MSDTDIGILVFGIYGIICAITMIFAIFVESGCFGSCSVLLSFFMSFKLLEMLQNKLLERRAKKKYYDEDEYRNENEDWYSEE